MPLLLCGYKQLVGVSGSGRAAVILDLGAAPDQLHVLRGDRTLLVLAVSRHGQAAHLVELVLGGILSTLDIFSSLLNTIWLS